MKRNARSFIVDKLEIPGKPGAIQLLTAPDIHPAAGEACGINHCCPCGCGAWGFIAFKNYGCGQMWDRAGDDGHMTLSPSIGFQRQPDGSYHWHGYLRDGVFEEI